MNITNLVVNFYSWIYYLYHINNTNITCCDSNVPLWGLEAIYRNNRLVGYLRRTERGYSCEKTIGHG